MSRKIALYAGYLFDGEKLSKDVTVLIEGEKVTKVEEGFIKPDGYEIIDKKEHFAFPAFVDTHTHSAMTGMRGLADDLPLMEWLNKYIFPVELKLVDRDFINTFFPLALVEMIHSGIGTFADMYFFQDEAALWVKKAGLRAVLAEGVIDFGTPNKKSVEEQLSFVEEFIKNFKKDDNVIPAIGPHAPYTCSPELLKKSWEIAEKYDVPYLIHVSETEDEVEIILKKYGKRPVIHLKDIGVLGPRVVSAHSVHLNDEEMEIFKEKEVGVSHNPQSNMKLASGVAPLKKYIDMGIKVSVGTDGTASNNNLDFIDELRSASLLQKVFTKDPTALPAEITLKIGTKGGAEVLGLRNVGEIKAGFSADIAVLNLSSSNLVPVYNPVSHLIYAASAQNIDTLIVKGKVIMEDFEIKTLDEYEIKEKAKRYSQKIKEVVNEG